MNKTNIKQCIKNQSKIIHIGLGAFHRAHQALYTSELIDQEKCNWSINSINLFGSVELITQLRGQNHVYAVLERGPNHKQVKISKSITHSLHPALDGKEPILEALADENTAIVSLTITEKGYCIEPSSGTLDSNNPLIQQDLKSPYSPNSAIGYIVEALRLRKQHQRPPFTVMSCDNIQSNGDVARQAILGYAKLIEPELYQWIKEHVTFPNTMVDRIVPAVTADTLSYIESQLGYRDPCAIACEPFRQWVIEDNFVNGRPDWDQVGAEFVEDVVPYEQMKLRMLNGSHSFLSYLGYLSGYKFISQVIDDKQFLRAVLDFMLAEQAPTLNLPKEVNVEHYATLLVDRFSNNNLQHATSQIATDGSQKLPPRFCESLIYNRRNGIQTYWLELGIAAWMSYVIGKDDNGDAIEVNDPLSAVFDSIKSSPTSNRERALALINLDSIFSDSIVNDTELVDRIVDKFVRIQESGAKVTVYNMVNDIKLKPLSSNELS
ncbi:mannitol dehydrogenase family protein [Vibrio hippocampi]|uniref:Polyol:NADP oxidoreductase n=1 Tax=Vibrio hippocampi TaxID=654686 RepID=A0ABN8DPR4_9VIBR|nr:fructuronate reductase [Vibrio hippocampi]CAH0529990.1 Polyol:NADP oxidoreductase [Vibrio hippocampi]